MPCIIAIGGGASGLGKMVGLNLAKSRIKRETEITIGRGADPHDVSGGSCIR